MRSLELPYFAAFDLLKERRRAGDACAAISSATRKWPHRSAIGLVLESATWRANPDWAAKLGYDAAALARREPQGIELLLEVRADSSRRRRRRSSSAAISARAATATGADARMSAGEARAYHGPQIADFAATDADMVAAFTMNYVEEAIGIALGRAALRACRRDLVHRSRPTASSPSGQPLGEAIDASRRRRPAATRPTT